jgi:hypothetical protein
MSSKRPTTSDTLIFCTDLLAGLSGLSLTYSISSSASRSMIGGNSSNAGVRDGEGKFRARIGSGESRRSGGEFMFDERGEASSLSPSSVSESEPRSTGAAYLPGLA